MQALCGFSPSCAGDSRLEIQVTVVRPILGLKYVSSHSAPEDCRKTQRERERERREISRRAKGALNVEKRIRSFYLFITFLNLFMRLAQLQQFDDKIEMKADGQQKDYNFIQLIYKLV